MAPKIDVKQEEGKEIPVEIIATAIVEIAAAMKQINATRLNRKALLVLLSNATELSQARVNCVLNALEQLEDLYCTPKGRRK